MRAKRKAKKLSTEIKERVLQRFLLADADTASEQYWRHAREARRYATRARTKYAGKKESKKAEDGNPLQ